MINHFQTLVTNSEVPILIDGLALDMKETENWVSKIGSPVVINLRVGENELIKRTRKKAEADVNAEVTEEEKVKAKESLTKNEEWTDHFIKKSPLTLLFQVDFSQPLILS